jgi:hypothetical protein
LSEEVRTKISSACPTIATPIAAMANQNCPIVVSGSQAVGTNGSVKAASSWKMASMATPRMTGGTSEKNRDPILARTPTTNHRRLPWPYFMNSCHSGCSISSRWRSMYSESIAWSGLTD